MRRQSLRCMEAIFLSAQRDECYGESEYVLIESAEYTDVQDITEGAICKK